MEKQKKVEYLKLIYICKWYIFICFLLFMAFFSAIRFFGEGPDYSEYERLFIYNNYSRDSLEPAYEVIRKINDIISPNSIFWVFFFSALTAMILKIKAFSLITKHPIRATIYCLLSLFFIHEYTQIRAAVAIGIFLLSISDIYANRPKRYFFKMCIAVCFHYSAIMMLPCWIYIHFFKKNKYYLIIPVIGFIIALLFGKNEELMRLIFIVEDMLGLNKSGNVSDFIKPYNLKYLVSLFGLYIIYRILPENDKKNTYLFRIYSFGLCCFYFILPAQLPVMAVRFAEFYTPVLFIVVINCYYYIYDKTKRFIYISYFHGYILLYLYASLNTTLL